MLARKATSRVEKTSNCVAQHRRTKIPVEEMGDVARVPTRASGADMIKNGHWGRLLVAVAAVVLIAGCDRVEPMSPVVDLGYLEIVPPSTFHLPGTINTVEFTSDGGVRLHQTCNVDQQTLMKEIQESEAGSRNISQISSIEQRISGKFEKVFESDAGRDKVKDRSLELRNLRILSTTDENLLRLQQSLLKGSCQEAVTINLENGGNVCQTRSVLKADFVYKISYQEGVSASVQSDITSRLAAGLDMNTRVVGKNYITGEKLFFAIRLFPHGIVINTPDSESSECLQV